MIVVKLRDKIDRNKCYKAAKDNGYRNASDWLRAIISGHFTMMGWLPLKIVTKSRSMCPNGHLYTKENTKWMKHKKRDLARAKYYKYKKCRICIRANSRRQYAKMSDRLIAAGKRKRNPRLNDGRTGYGASRNRPISNEQS